VRPGRRRVGLKDPQAVVELVRQLGGLLGELGLAEVEVGWDDVRLRVQRSSTAPAPVAPSPSALVAAPVEAPATIAAPPGLLSIEAPMVGTFYRAPAPTADPYVAEGDLVKEGQIVGIIEAMKLMNEIEAKTAGRIVKILVANGQPVEYGQPLFLVDPLR
jgi:acetyl-CoA carboxylase biotin carboxyl carrier protein